MARIYNRPPGVTITEKVDANVISPIIATPDRLALVGPASGLVQITEQLTLVGTEETKLKSISDSDILTEDSIVKVLDQDSAVAQQTNPAYSSNSGYPSTSYVFDPVNHTIQRNTEVSVCTLNSSITTSAATSITINANDLEGLENYAAENGVIYIDKEQIGYETATYTQTTPTNEIQTVSVTGATGGTFTLTYNGQTTANIAYNASPASGSGSVSAKLKALSNIGNNDVVVTGTSGSYTITFQGDLASENVSALIVNGTNLTGTSEVQEVTITGTPTAGTFTLTFDDDEAVIAFDATASDVEDALEGLTSIGTGNVSVTYDAGVYTITFQGDLAETNVSTIIVDDAALVDATAEVSVDTEGSTPNVTVSTTTQGADGADTITFSTLTRGINGTTASGHDAGASVSSGLIIPDGRSVLVTYLSTPNNYYFPRLFNSGEYSKIEKLYGSAFKDDGVAINSPLSLAAKIAIENGANELILQPTFYSEDDIDGELLNRQAPTNEQLVDSTNTWNKSFRSLQSEEGVGIIVPIIGQDLEYNYGSGAVAELNDIGQSSIEQTLLQHIAYMRNEYDQLSIGIIGEDSTNNSGENAYATRETLINHIQTLNQFNFGGQSFSEQIVFIAQTHFTRVSTKSPTTYLPLGGQYAAAAIGGRLSALSPEVTLTRKGINGFNSIVDTRTKAIKTKDSGLGFLVIEQDPYTREIVVRHGLTIDTNSVSTSELNVIRAKHFMINSLRKTIDTQIVGKVVADETATTTVVTTIASTLRTLQDDGVIVQFNSVEAQIDSIDPTQIGVRFNYRPAFTVNYINIEFSVDLSSGVTSLTTVDQANIGA